MRKISLNVCVKFTIFTLKGSETFSFVWYFQLRVFWDICVTCRKNIVLYRMWSTLILKKYIVDGLMVKMARKQFWQHSQRLHFHSEKENNKISVIIDSVKI